MPAKITTHDVDWQPRNQPVTSLNSATHQRIYDFAVAFVCGHEMRGGRGRRHIHGAQMIFLPAMSGHRDADAAPRHDPRSGPVQDHGYSTEFSVGG